MGGSSSKPTVVVPAAPVLPDINRATFSGEYATELAQKAADAQAAATAAANSAAAEIANAAYWFKAKLGGAIFIFLAIAGVLIWYFLSRKPDGSDGGGGSSTPTTLVIQKATHTDNDVTTKTQALVQGGAYLTIKPSLIKNIDPTADASTYTGKYVISYQFSDESGPRNETFNDTDIVSISPGNRTGYTAPGSTQATGPTTPMPQATAPTAGSSLWSRVKSYFSGSGDSGDQLPNAKDAKSSASIPSASAPLSGQDKGGYGMQWWMYINDWDYKYGKEKHVLSRSDPSNSGIVNPRVMLHPTENTLQIAVSVYGSGEDSANASTPDADMFVCEVPDVPLQSWFSVSVTLFDRNMDIYLNGNLVKSCVLPGVPKSAAGNVELNNNGGFSGYLCNFYAYPRMLIPSDAQTFYAAGTSCSTIKSASPTLQNALTGGYSLKFGLTDTTGKQIDNYTF
jgi:hypothetical protein